MNIHSEHGQTFTVKSNDAYGTTTMNNRSATTVEEQLGMCHNEAYGTSTVVNDNEDHEYDYVINNIQ